jgi:hypothetical protein
MIHNFFQLNELISERLKSNEPFSLLRIDNTMGYVLDSLQKNTTPVNQFYNENTLIEGGIYPNNMDYAYDVVNKSFLKHVTTHRNYTVLCYYAVNNHQYLIKDTNKIKSLVEKAKDQKNITFDTSILEKKRN